MKELSIEKKAKAYDEALEKARQFSEHPLLEDSGNIVEYIFPELKESEDERIKKRIIHALHGDVLDMEETNKAIAWLEKQGEQKPFDYENANIQQKDFAPNDEEMRELLRTEYEKGRADTIAEMQNEQKPVDKTEPKFKVGDWIITEDKNVHEDYRICKICKIDNDKYYIENGDFLNKGTLDAYEYHLWTIQDAKDGDVLYSPCLELLWIFKSRDTVYCGCNLNYNDGAFCGEGYIEMPTDAIPATKEQHDTLMKAMTDAGWEFDFEKKELKKISQRMISAEAKEAMYGNPAWSEEDECILFRTINDLKFLKDTISIDPKYAINIIDIEREIDWLKSLKTRYTWKPSDEQMVALKHAFNDCSIAFADMKILATLYEELKALHHYEQDT